MPGHFETNLSRLRARDRRFADLVAATNCAPFERVGASKGRTTLRVGGMQLSSAYHPVEEGRRAVAPLLEADPDLLVVIGVGLGHAIEAFREHRAAPVLIYEPSLARLRLAMEERDLRWLGELTTHWAESLEVFAPAFRTLYTAGLRAEAWVHPVARRLDAEAVGSALESLAGAKRASDITDRTRVLMNGSFADQSIDNLRGLLTSPPLSGLAGTFKGVPAVIAAAGPSLDRQLDTLAEFCDGALVIAIGQTLPALRRAGIRSDFTHVVESQDVSHQLCDGGDSRDVNLVVIPSVHPSLFEAPVATRFVAYPNANPMARWMADVYGDTQSVPGAPTVAQSAVHLAAVLGADPILLIGQDLAFSDGRVYAQGSAYEMVSFRQVGEGRFVYTGEDEKARLLHQAPRGPESRSAEIVWVPGWDGERVPTSPQYASFISHYPEVMRAHRGTGVRVVNCTEGGARIPGLEHAAFAETLRAHRAQHVPREQIDKYYRAFKAWPAERLAARVEEAHHSLRRLVAVRRRGLRVLRGVRPKLHHVDPAGQVAALRRLARAHRRLADAVEALPWLDMAGQKSVYRAELALHRTRELPPLEAAMDEADALLRATGESAERGRVLLDRLDRRIREVEGVAECSRTATSRAF